MGVFDTIKIEEGVELPHYPEDAPRNPGWQTKSLTRRGDTFKISEDGRLMRQEVSHREKTDEEKQEEAERFGFDSWEKYDQALEDAVNSDEPIEAMLEIGPEDEYPGFYASESTIDEKFWVDHNYHGTVSFYANGGRVEGLPDDTFVQYKASFTRGDLDKIELDARSHHDYDSEELAERLENY